MATNTSNTHGAGSVRVDFLKIMLLGILVVTVGFFTAMNPKYFSWRNFIFLLIQNSFIIIAGCGVTLLMVAGYIDLSVGSTLVLAGVVHAYFCRAGLSTGVAMLIAAAVGTLVGYLNAVMIIKLKITPFIATLGTMYLGRGLSYVVAGDLLVIREGLPKSFPYIGNEYVGPVPIVVVVMLGVLALFLVLERTSVLGKYSVAIGGNRTAAILSGINADGIVQTLYVICGTLSAISGVFMASRFGTGDPNMGIGFEFDVIIAVILGGTSLAGGEGSIIGMIVGSLIIGALANGLKIMNVFTFYQSVMKGVVLVVAVVIYENLKKRLKAGAA
jgi:ribose/xylose/arabinose/galactoside ABC-type transport system permease subunit